MACSYKPNYVYSKDESGAYTRVSGKLSAEATEYEIKDLDLKGKYTYVVTTVATVDNKDYESVWSNEAHYRADEAPYIGSNGNWWVGGTDTGVKAAGDDGKPGKDGETPYIGENGNWWIGFTDTKVKAAGTDGKDGEKGEDGETPYISLRSACVGTVTFSFSISFDADWVLLCKVRFFRFSCIARNLR